MVRQNSVRYRYRRLNTKEYGSELPPQPSSGVTDDGPGAEIVKTSPKALKPSAPASLVMPRMSTRRRPGEEDGEEGEDHRDGGTAKRAHRLKSAVFGQFGQSFNQASRFSLTSVRSAVIGSGDIRRTGSTLQAGLSFRTGYMYISSAGFPEVLGGRNSMNAWAPSG